MVLGTPCPELSSRVFSWSIVWRKVFISCATITAFFPVPTAASALMAALHTASGAALVVTCLEEGFHILRDHYGVLPRLHGCFSPHGCSPHRIWCCSLGRRCKERFIALCFPRSAVPWIHVTVSTLRNNLNLISKEWIFVFNTLVLMLSPKRNVTRSLC